MCSLRDNIQVNNLLYRLTFTAFVYIFGLFFRQLNVKGGDRGQRLCKCKFRYTNRCAVIKLAQKDYQTQTAAYAGHGGQTAEKMWNPAEI